MMNLLLRGLLQVSPEIPLQTIFHASSEQATAINKVTIYFFLAAAAVLLVVIALTVLIVYKYWYRKKLSDPATVSKKWEIAMIGIPTFMVGVFLYLSIDTMSQVHPEPHNRQADVVIRGHQWWWSAEYAGSNVQTANEIHLPTGKKILLQLESADVVHDWWVPSFGNKMDLVPSQTNYLWLTINQQGEYHGACSEFCGAQHAHMRIRVIAESESAFQQWLNAQSQPAITTAENEKGKQLFMTNTCSNCHRIAGTAANGDVGPDLTHLASRTTLLSGMLENNYENLKTWIAQPQKVKPGAHMPDFLMEDSTIMAITKYLYSLK